MIPCWTLTALLFMTRVTALSSRERLPSNCGFAHYGSAAGSAQRLVETHLAPGVADWNIVVPMPPPCAGAQVMGADMRVCDADAPPHIAMSDARSAHVHRAGQLAGFATVNVTVYCILPPSPPLLPSAPPPPPPPPTITTTSIASPLLHLTYKMLSNELSSNEVTSNEETSYESESTDLKSKELTTTLMPTSSITLPPTQEEMTAQAELTPPTEVVTAQPNNTTNTKDKTPHSLKVTINITPTNQVSIEEDESQSYIIEQPSLLTKEKPDEVMLSQSPKFSSVPYIVTLPRISAMPPWEQVKKPRVPGSPAQQAAALHLPPGAYPHPGAHQPLSVHRPSSAYRPPGAYPHPGAHQQPSAQWPPSRPRLRPLHYPLSLKYSVMPSQYDLMPPYSLARVYRPLSLLSPQLTFLQRRQPLLFFRHF